jgi:ribonucleoside-triphosphate reductase (formate)
LFYVLNTSKLFKCWNTYLSHKRKKGVILPKFVIKRDGSKVKFDSAKIKSAIWKAAKSVGGKDEEKAKHVSSVVIERINNRFKEEDVPTVEQIQDIVEEVLIKAGHDKVAKSYILYRHQHELLRMKERMLSDFDIVDSYVSQEDWRVKENSNMAYSLQGLRNHIASNLVSNYWLMKIYPLEIGNAHKNGDLHIHDLSELSVYCVGWDLKQLLIEGFKGVRGKINCAPAKHFRSALGQIVNFFYTLQGEAAGAQAFSSFDTLLAPFIRYNNLNRKEVKQALQEFLFNCNVPTRVGFQTPFENITLDLTIPENMKNLPVIIGGKAMDAVYGDFQEEMDLFNDVLAEVMVAGDADGRIFTFPIPTYNITPDFDWGSNKYNKIWEMTAKYGIPYFANFVNSDMKAEDARSMCLDYNEEILVKINGEIRRELIGDLIETFGGEGWVENDYDIEALSLKEDYSLEWVKIKNFLKTRLKGNVKITTKDGKKISSSFNHPVSVLTPNGIEEKLAKDIVTGDYMLSLKSAENNLSKEKQKIGGLFFDKELAFFLGFFTADGNYLYKSKSKKLRGIQLTFNAKEKKSLDKIKKFIKNNFAYSVKEKKDPRYNSYCLYIYKTELAKLFFNSGFKKYGRLPNILFNSPKEVIESFLEGFFEGDGYAKRKEIHINDNLLIRDLTLLYNIVGQPNSLKIRKNSQRLYLHHKKSDESSCGHITNCTSELVPGFTAKSTYVVPGLNKNSLVGLQTLKKYSAETIFSKKLSSAQFYVSRVVLIEKNENTQNFYDIELEHNHRFVHSLGTITHNCCRLRLDNKELRKRGGGLFGSNPMTGSIGVVTINMPRIAYLSKTEKEFFERLGKVMDLAKESLVIKRKILENLTINGLYPYSSYYLRGMKESTGQYWKNHFSTIGLIGMNEALLNFLNKNIAQEDGIEFSKKVMFFMRDKLTAYQEETGDLFNLEATPGEGTSRRLANSDKKKYPGIITANEASVKKGATPYYANSTQLPVGYTHDLFDALDKQDSLQTLYTGGTVFHVFVGEKLPSAEAAKNLIRKITSNYSMPYISLTPTFSICPIHGYLSGEHEYCPICDKEDSPKIKEKILTKGDEN